MTVIESRDLGRAAAAQGGRLRVENVHKADTGESEAFELERFEVFTADTRITVHGPRGDEVLPPPANAYFRGVVAGRPDSRVFLAVLPDGRTQGVVNEGEESYLIGGEDEPAAKALGAPLAMHRVEPGFLKASRGEGFECGNSLLPPVRDNLAGLDFTAEPPAAVEKALAEADTAALAAYTARVAIETDYEFYSKFNNAAAASTYIGNLIGYASVIYTAEINTSLTVQSISLWTTSDDPWNQTTGLCGLLEFGRYWNKNKTDVSRTIAHFMSGRPTGGGVAWLGVLCSGAFSASGSCSGIPTDAPWGGGYGFTGGMSGTFNIANPTVMWDIMAVSHEIGHNFNSPHTHCYNGVGGNASPVDQCRTGESGCFAGTQSLPGPAGAGSGTIMSYCHLLSGGFSNISLTFGTNHPYGVQPGRVPSRMSAYVASRAASNPSCLAPAAPTVPAIFSDGFESGGSAAWH
ncbi:MAG TPA: M12 family metallo-peptidase [Thermoanaerobaculia bacterium]